VKSEELGMASFVNWQKVLREGQIKTLLNLNESRR